MDQPLQVPPPIPVAAPATPLPLRFNVPPGWPAPSTDWLAANLGWDPPTGWVPVHGVVPAPSSWVWWSKDPVGWPAMTSGVTSSHRNGIIVGSVIFVVGVLLTFLPVVLHVSFSFIFWGAIIFGPINVARNIGALRRSTAAFTAFVRSKAAEIRQTLDAQTYSGYLATSPVEPLPFDRFLAKRGAEAWSFTGQWPLDQDHVGVTEQFRVAAPRKARARRISTAVFAGIAVIALVALIGGGLSAAQSGNAARGASSSSNNGTSSNSAQGGSGASAGGSVYDATWSWVDENTPTSAQCTGTLPCWIVRVKTDPSCSQAGLMVDFYTSKDATTADHSQNYSAAVTNGTVDIAFSASTKAEQYADVYQAHCVLLH